MLPPCDWNVCDEKTTRYRRTHNAPVYAAEERLNELYGAWRTVLTNSGMEAVNTVFDILRPPAVIVDEEAYFETREWLQWSGRRVITLSTLNDMDALENALLEAGRGSVVCGDSPTTFGRWLDVENISKMSHRYGAFVMMDNSIVSLYYSNPIKHGADIVAESYSKYLCGYGDCFAGGIALAPSMKWMEDMEIPLANPGQDNLSCILSRRGNCANPRAAYMAMRGLETLAVRMERHTANAKEIYNALTDRDIPALYAGVGGLITLPGRTEAFCHRLKKFKTLGTFGMTYSNADFFRSKERYLQGICARLSVGLEDPAELVDDVLQAIKEDK